MNYKFQVLRGEKWFHLMSKEDIDKLEKTNSSIPEDVKVYLASVEKVKAKKEK